MSKQTRKDIYTSATRCARVAPTAITVRAADSGDGLHFSGYASVTNVGYAIRDWLGEYEEIMAPGCFRKSLDERDDVRLLVNHDGIPLARTKSGTLDLREITDPNDDPQELGQTGLWCDADLDGNSPLVRSVKSAMDRGDLDQMSFAFSATRQEWNEDYTQRTVREAKLFDVSVVTYPASPTTSAGLRGLEPAKLHRALEDLKHGRALDPADVNMLTQALGWLSSIDNIVDAGQEALSAYLGQPNPDDDDVEENAARLAELEARELELMITKATAGLAL